jgi:hypothetical protein
MEGKSKQKVILYGVGTVSLIGLTFLVIHLTKNKNENENQAITDANEEGHQLSTEQVNSASVSHQSGAGLPRSNARSAFPLKEGDKGGLVFQLQRAIINRYGASALAKYGEDGHFGKEVVLALRNRGFKIPLSENDFKKITGQDNQATKTVTPPIPNPSKAEPSLNAKGIADAFFVTLSNNDTNGAITLLKALKQPNDYSKVNEYFKLHRIGGLRQTLVTALFKKANNDQKESIKKELLRMGLKTDGKKWFF